MSSGFTWNGITSDGTSLFLADAQRDRIYQYSLGGMLLGSFNPGIGSLSGITYDSATDSLWVVNGSLPLQRKASMSFPRLEY